MKTSTNTASQALINPLQVQEEYYNLFIYVPAFRIWIDECYCASSTEIEQLLARQSPNTKYMITSQNESIVYCVGYTV